MTRPSHALTMATPIARGDSLNTSHNRGVSGSVIEVIERQAGLPLTAVQRRAHVQELSPCEIEFMEALDSLGTIVTAQRLADELGTTAKRLRRHELHDLQVKGVIESVQGQRGGYRRKK